MRSCLSKLVLNLLRYIYIYIFKYVFIMKFLSIEWVVSTAKINVSERIMSLKVSTWRQPVILINEKIHTDVLSVILVNKTIAFPFIKIILLFTGWRASSPYFLAPCLLHSLFCHWLSVTEDCGRLRPLVFSASRFKSSLTETKILSTNNPWIQSSGAYIAASWYMYLCNPFFASW